ncbi:MAG: ABC transporter permease subunit [Clostridia bacterium]|nr:ABC transporter permease subunit [Clostridia bacterium]
MIAIFKREMQSYFTSPIGYVYICAYLFATALFFKMYILDTGVSNVVYFFGGTLIIYMFLVPILTMRLFSEEQKSKTDQILLTSPVSVTGIVLGKFLAALSVYTIALIPTAVSIGFVAHYGDVSLGLTLGNYIGILFLGMSFIAIGCFLSAVTESQVVAAVLSFTVLMSLYFLDTLASSVNSAFLAKVVSFISVYDRYTDFTSGLFSLSSIVYYISVAVIFLFLTIRIIEKRRWS